MLMAIPNTYVLGSVPEIDLTTKNLDGTIMVPVESRVSFKQPNGTIVTYSGGAMTAASGYQYVLYRPPTIGWYEYEGWVKDSSGREIVKTNGFEVIDRVY